MSLTDVECPGIVFGGARLQFHTSSAEKNVADLTAHPHRQLSTLLFASEALHFLMCAQAVPLRPLVVKDDAQYG